MNIFITNEDPQIAAQESCWEHLVKMRLEVCQLLSTALHLHPLYSKKIETVTLEIPHCRPCKEYSFQGHRIYAKTHTNHPSARWVRESNGNWKWTIKYLDHLQTTFLKYSNNGEKIEPLRRFFLEIEDLPISSISEVTLPKLAMPEVLQKKYGQLEKDCRFEHYIANSWKDATEAYQLYISTKVFKNGKRPSWKSQRPSWYKELWYRESCIESLSLN